MLGGQRDEGQVVGAGGGLAGDARVGQASRDGRGQVQVPGRAGAVPAQLARRDPGAGQFAVEQGARLRARFAVHQPQPALGQVPDTGDAAGPAGPYR